jgi:hypothetical protein
MISFKVSDRLPISSLRFLLAASFTIGVQLFSHPQFASGQERNEGYPSIYRTDHRGENARHKQVPVPFLGIALVGLGIGFIHKHKQSTSSKK